MVKNRSLTNTGDWGGDKTLRNARVSKAKVKEAPEGEAAEGEEGEGGGKKKLPLKLMIIAGVGALVVLGGGGTAAMLLLKPKDEAHAEKGDHGKEKKKEKKEKGGDHGGGKEGEGAVQVTEGPDGVLFYPVPPLVVNMQTADGRPTFLKLKLTLELPEEEAVETLNLNMPRLQDMFQTFLRELRPEDLQGSQGSYQLRMELQRRVNLVIAPGKVNAVLIEEQLIN